MDAAVPVCVNICRMCEELINICRMCEELINNSSPGHQLCRPSVFLGLWSSWSNSTQDRSSDLQSRSFSDSFDSAPSNSMASRCAWNTLQLSILVERHEDAAARIGPYSNVFQRLKRAVTGLYRNLFSKSQLRSQLLLNCAFTGP
jgi:hypothetical protein